MGLLSVEKRKLYFDKLGLGAYNKANIEKFQRKYFRRENDIDGAYGPDTDKLLRHVYNCSLVPDFSPKEFKCECGGRFCTGYPTYMKQAELKNLQSIRAHFGRPIVITSGMRCKKYNNSLRGSSSVSGHMSGYAADIYIKGVTDSLAGRKKLIAYAKKLPNHKYSYCNGWNSNGVRISAGYMGNAVHVESKKAPQTAKKTVKLAASAVPTAPTRKVTQYLTQAQLNKWFAALKKEYENAKNSVYVWIEGPTYSNSRRKSTCIAEHSVALQLLGILPKGRYFYYHPKKKRISGNAASYVKKHTELFKLSYPHKKLKTLIKQGKLQPGDMVFFGDPGYHSMTYMGLNGKGEPVFATLGHKKGYGVTYPYYAKRKVDMLVRLKKVSK